MLDIKNIKHEYEQLLNQLSDPGLISDWERFEELSKKKTQLEKIIKIDEEIKELNDKINENSSIIAAGEDKELLSLAETETAQLKEKQIVLEKELNSLLSEGKTKDPGAIIIEIRAGAGGDEAGIFVADLFRMYTKYAQANRWQQKVLDSHKTTLGGFKEMVFELKGQNIFSKMQHEAGVHRVQRIPNTEKNGRVHTSTVSVAVLAKPKKTQINIRADEIRVDFYRASGPGGQHVNRRETAVRITHLKSGVVVTSQEERSQLQNKENAMAILAAKVQELKMIQEVGKVDEKRKAQIKQAKRAEKIRTYNFPQDRVTDHRIKKNFHNIEGIMDGKLDPLIEALKKEEE